MNILIISCVFPPEPVVSAMLSYDIATELTHKGYQVTVLSPTPSRPQNFKFSQSKLFFEFKHIITDSYTCPKSNLIGRIKESYSFGLKCSEYIQMNFSDIDLVYMNSWPLFSQYLIMKTTKKFKIPTIVHVQDIYPESISNKLRLGGSILQRFLLPIDKYVLSNAKKVICISENMRQHLSKTRRISTDKLFIISNWQNEDSFIEYKKNNPDSNKSEMPFTFMYLGNNGPVAGVEFLIESFVKANIKDSRLLIAGNGSRTNACKELVKNLGAVNVFFITVPEGKVPEIQSQADVFLLPVKKGGAMSSIPSKLPAYMFSSKPIIGSLDLESDTARAIIEADCGIVVEPENEVQLIGAMRDIYNWDSERLSRTGGNGFKYAIQNFSKSQNLNKIINLITEK
jgi:glycosyltransferase involved in cell wall biosynthesis